MATESRQQREAKARRKKKPGAAPPIAFRLHTERAAQEHDESRRQRVSRQDLASQHKLLGKKTVEDFARLRLVRPQDRATWQQQNLHQNGGQQHHHHQNAKLHDNRSQQEHHRRSAETASAQHKPLLSARERPADSESPPLRRARPQSAKPVLQHPHQVAARGSFAGATSCEVVSGSKVSVQRLESCGYNPIPITTGQLLSSSQSAAQLRVVRREPYASKTPSKTGASTSHAVQESAPPADLGVSKKHIVVYMHRVQLDESDDSDDNRDGDDRNCASRRDASPQQQHASELPPPRRARSAWCEDSERAE